MIKNYLNRERLEKIKSWRETYGAGSNVMLPAEEAEELACLALAALDSEPVAVVEPSDYVTAAQLVGEGPARKAVHELYEGALRIGDKLYRHAQPAVDSDFIPKNLDKALGVVGVAIPESREEFNLQAERWIQRLIDRVIRYADEFQEQSAPVVDADDNFYSWFGREWHENYQHNQYTTAAKQMLGVMAESAWKAATERQRQKQSVSVPDVKMYEDVPYEVGRLKTHRDCYCDDWNACRAAMLNGGKS